MTTAIEKEQPVAVDTICDSCQSTDHITSVCPQIKKQLKGKQRKTAAFHTSEESAIREEGLEQGLMDSIDVRDESEATTAIVKAVMENERLEEFV